MFSIIFDHTIECLLAPGLRFSRMIAWLISLTYPIKMLFEGPAIVDNFKSFRLAILDRVSFNSQVIYLEYLLNEVYNSNNQGLIYIEDTTNPDRVYLSNKGEGYPPVYIGNKGESGSVTYIGNKAEYALMFDFVIWVPAAIYSALLLNNNEQLNNMKALVNFYKIAGKRYTIESY